jgi:hypothetical protein
MTPNGRVRGRSGVPVGRAARAREAPSPAGEGQGPLVQRVLAAAQAAGSLIESWGFRAIDGRVWTLFALSREPLSRSQLARALGVSRSLVSPAVTELAGFGLVRAIGESRNAPHEARLDVWPASGGVLRSRERMLVESARVALGAAVQEAELSSPGPYELSRMRLLLIHERARAARLERGAVGAGAALGGELPALAQADARVLEEVPDNPGGVTGRGGAGRCPSGRGAHGGEGF